MAEFTPRAMRILADRVEIFDDVEATNHVMTLPVWLIERIVQAMGPEVNGMAVKVDLQARQEWRAVTNG